MSRSLNDVVILSANRTPIGSFQGFLKNVSAVDLASVACKAAIKNAGLTPCDIQEVYMGQVIQSGSKQLSARQVAIKSGCPVTTECTTINKACASSLKAVYLAFQSLQLGNRDIMLAGGMESMSNCPFLVPREQPTYGGQMMHDTIIYDGLKCPFNNIHMGECTEKLATRFNITRENQDAYAILSYSRSRDSWEAGIYDNEVVPVEITDLKTKEVIIITRDEEYSNLKVEKVPSLRPAFMKDGTITAANSSKLSDGASAVVLCSMVEASSRKLKPLARIIACADAATEPIEFGLAPALAIKNIIEKTKIKLSDISLFEINEAFSAVSLAVIKYLELDPTIVNIHGGAVSLGHPVGSSGTRILGHLVHALQKGQYGIAAICNGGGGSTAVLIEKL